MPKVKIEAVNVLTNVTANTETNDAGVYTVASLQPGIYRIIVQKEGFDSIVKPDITLHVQDDAVFNFQLRIGSTSTVVTVEAGALVMNTTDASVSTVIDRQFVENIPLNGRSFQDLISLAPGVLTQSPQSGSYFGNNGDFSVNGQRTESNYYTVDGVSANTFGGGGTNSGGPGPFSSGSLPASTALGTTQSLLSVDDLQEFRIESSTYSAEYGRSPGGQFSFASRSGTSSFHGSLFEYFRNDVLDANDWFNDYYGIAKPALRQNDFGGTFGGPVWIPGHEKGKSNTFVFVSYEGLRLTQPTEASLQYVPSNSLRASAPSVLQPILNAFPAPTGPEIQTPCDNVTFQCPAGQAVGTLVPSGLAPFVEAYSLPSTINSTSIRLDHIISSRLHAFFRASYTPSSSYSRYLSSYGPSTSNLQSYTGGLDAQISNSLNNELRIGYARFTSDYILNIDSFGGNTPVNFSQAFGTGSYSNANPIFSYQPSSVGSTTLTTQDTSNYSRQWNLTDTVSWAHGRHSIKAGVDYRRITSSYAPYSPEVGYGYYSPSSILNNSADSLSVYLQQSPLIVYNQLSLFAQDEWRLTPTLTLSTGLRWEFDPAPYSTDAAKPYPLEGNPNDPSTYTLGAPGSRLYNTAWSNFAPRLGVAWNAHGGPGAQTVVRAGFGVFYDTGTSSINQLFASLGTTSLQTATSAPFPVAPASLIPSYAVNPPYGTYFAVAPNLKLPYTLQWNAAVEQAIGSHQNVTVTYVGADGRRLVGQSAIRPGTLNPDFTEIILSQNGFTSNYQALQVQYQRQMQKGVQALASYTWSHSLDYGSSDGAYVYKRGNSDFDVRNSFNAAVTWDPHVSLSNAIFGALLSGWGVDARVFERTGFPVTLRGNAFFDPATGTLQFTGLNLVPSVPLYIYSSTLPGGRQINPEAFTSAPVDTIGDAPRNFARGFGEQQFNLAIRREFHLFEGLKMQFRAEAFNVFNHPNFGYVDPRLGDTTFGQATMTLGSSLGTVSPLYQQGGARSVQLALKLLFRTLVTLSLQCNRSIPSNEEIRPGLWGEFSMLRILARFALRIACVGVLLCGSDVSAQIVHLDEPVAVSSPNDGAQAWYEMHVQPDNAMNMIICGTKWAGNAAYGFVYYSHDGGKSWTQALEDKSSAWVSEQSCAYGVHGVAYFVSDASRVFDGELHHGLGTTRIYVSRDSGKTWGVGAKTGWTDASTSVVDTTPGPNENRLYVYFNGLQAFYHSLGQIDDANAEQERVGNSHRVGMISYKDGDAQVSGPFSSAEMINEHYHGVYPGPALQLNDGSIVAFFTSRRTTQHTGVMEYLALAVRTNADRHSLGKPVTIVDTLVDSTDVDGIAYNCNNFYDTAGAYDTAHDRLYFAYPDVRNKECRLILTSSADGGRSWAVAAPVRSPDETPTTLYVNPTIAINQEGVLAVMWQQKERSSCWMFAISEDRGISLSRAKQLGTCSGDVRMSSTLSTAHIWTMIYQADSPANASDAARITVRNMTNHVERIESAVAVTPDGAFKAVWTDAASGGGEVCTAAIRVTSAASLIAAQTQGLADVTNKVVVLYGGSQRYDARSGIITIDVVVQNKGTEPIRGPFRFAMTRMFDDYGFAQAANSTNGVAGAGAVWDISPSIPAGTLNPGVTSRPFPLKFHYLVKKGDKGEERPLAEDLFDLSVSVFAGSQEKSENSQ